MTDEYNQQSMVFLIKRVVARLEAIEKRLDALESRNEWESRLNEVMARRVEEDMKHESPEHNAKVKEKVEEILMEARNEIRKEN